jgi:hypothetical protein
MLYDTNIDSFNNRLLEADIKFLYKIQVNIINFEYLQ